MAYAGKLHDRQLMRAEARRFDADGQRHCDRAEVFAPVKLLHLDAQGLVRAGDLKRDITADYAALACHECGGGNACIAAKFAAHHLQANGSRALWLFQKPDLLDGFIGSHYKPRDAALHVSLGRCFDYRRDVARGVNFIIRVLHHD